MRKLVRFISSIIFASSFIWCAHSEEIIQEKVAFSDIEVILNGVDEFAFDPALLIEDVSYGSPPTSISLDGRVRNTRFGKSKGYDHITLLNKNNLFVGKNITRRGHIGINDFDLNSEFINQGNRTTKHIVAEVSLSNFPEALVMVKGSRYIQVLQGDKNSSFKKMAKRIYFEKPVVDLSKTNGAGLHRSDANLKDVVSILHDNYFNVYNIQSALGKPVFSRDIFLLPEQRFNFEGKGIIITSHNTSRYLTFAVLSKLIGKLKLTSFVFNKAAPQLGFTERSITIPVERFLTSPPNGDEEKEEPIAIKLVTPGANRSKKAPAPPAIVLLSSVNKNTGNGMPSEGRLRLFNLSYNNFDVSTTRSITPLNEARNSSTHLYQGKLSLTLVKQKVKDIYKDYVVVKPNPAELKKMDEYIDNKRLCRNAEVNTTVRALSIADITSKTSYFKHDGVDIPKSDRSGPDHNQDIVVAGNVALSKCGGRPFVQILNISQTLQMERVAEKVVINTYKVSQNNEKETIKTSLKDTKVTDIAVSRFNSDSLPDVVLLDANSNNLILIRQQPRPCVTYITSIANGHQGWESITGNVTKTEYPDLYNRRLSQEIDKVNVERRTSSTSRPELCSAAHIPINAHWEKETQPGAFRHIAGRLSWLASSMVEVPVCTLTRPSGNIFSPIDYWLSYRWALLPYTPPCPLVWPAPTVASTAQIILAGMGAGLEYFGAEASGNASRSTANTLSRAINFAVEKSRKAMDECTGQVAVDSIGFSRGTTVVSEAMQNVDLRPLSFNAAASLVYLDSIDPSWGKSDFPPKSLTTAPSGDAIRPWARSGFMVGDPKVRAAGNALISSVYSGRPMDFLGDLDLFNNAIGEGVHEGTKNIARDIAGLPSGYHRLPSLENTGGWYASSGTTDHTGVRDSLLYLPKTTLEFLNDSALDKEDYEDLVISRLLDPTLSPPNYISNQNTSFATATRIGDLLLNPRNENIDYIGWKRNIPDNVDENSYLPKKCNPNNTLEPQEPNTVLSQKVTEFISDAFFNYAQGFVANATDLVKISKPLPKDSKYKLETLYSGPNAEPIREMIINTADQQLPSGKDFDSSWGTTFPCNDCPTLSSNKDESRYPKFISRLKSKLSLDSDNTEQKWSENTLINEENIDNDAVNMYGILASGASRLDDAQLIFNEAVTKITQKLRYQSTNEEKLIVRVFYQKTAPTGSLTVNLTGPRLSMTKSQNNIPINRLTEFRFEANRSSQRASGEEKFDSITLKGNDIRISSVSVRNELPWAHPSNDVHYEMVHMIKGVDWEAARSMAQERLFNGKKGKLAEFPNNDVKEVMSQLGVDQPVWLGARGKAGKRNSLRWETSQEIVNLSVETNTESKIQEDSYLFYSEADDQFYSSGMRATVDDLPIGFLISYQ